MKLNHRSAWLSLASYQCWNLNHSSTESSVHVFLLSSPCFTVVLYLFLVGSFHPAESFLWNLQVCAEGCFCVPVFPVCAIWWRSPHSPCGTWLRDLVVLISVATSLKWLMIMNPTGGEIQLICIYPRHHMHKYQSINNSLSSRVSGDLRFICSVSVMWMPWTCDDGWLTGMQTGKEKPLKVTALPCVAVGGGCVRTDREHLSSVFASDGSH